MTCISQRVDPFRFTYWLELFWWSYAPSSFPSCTAYETPMVFETNWWSRYSAECLRTLHISYSNWSYPDGEVTLVVLCLRGWRLCYVTPCPSRCRWFDRLKVNRIPIPRAVCYEGLALRITIIIIPVMGNSNDTHCLRRSSEIPNYSSIIKVSHRLTSFVFHRVYLSRDSTRYWPLL